jgi:biopolymer transport protein ExbB/TolQ
MQYKYLLILRYSLINLVGLIFLFVLITQGYVTKAIKADITNMVIVILTLFAVGFVLAAYRTFWLSRELNYSFFKILPNHSLAKEFLQSSKKLDASSRNNLAASLRIKLSSKINYIKFMANTLVILGLIGTVIGFIIALSGVDGSVSSNPEEVSKMVSTLIQGMSVALYTTLVGSICSVWLNVCYQIMSTGANNLLSKIIELGEKK